jgi:hypothetical protein
VAGALAGVLGVSTGPCSLIEAGVEALPVIGLPFTGLSSSWLTFLASLSQVAIWVALGAAVLGVVWLGWLAGAAAVSPRSDPACRRADAATA